MQYAESLITSKVDTLESVMASVLDSLDVSEEKDDEQYYQQFAATYLELWFEDYFVEPKIGKRSGDDYTVSEFLKLTDHWIKNSDKIHKGVRKAYMSSCKDGLLKAIGAKPDMAEDLIWEYSSYYEKHKLKHSKKKNRN
ncbi:hypothetical protein PO250_01860 [Limosilactobacillus mucosae]|uniref:Uncharacterized protein n=1 Tax=Limosilactobacillus mucosae TaxID=97478 RepID=A0AAJ1HQY8_LIMMU|nr:hypothetical protein [Limosilactobacillus mucosae]MDC2829081.1 hypothetical protein [Limosilactobacillus mucosae]